MSDAPLNPAILLRAIEARERGRDRNAELREEVAGLFDEWRKGLFRYVKGFGLTAHDTEDVLQDVFLALYRHLQQGKSRSNLPAWLFRVAHNVALKQRMRCADRQPQDREALEQQADPALNPEQTADAKQRERRVRAVFDALPEREQRCLALRLEGFRYREIAQVLGISLGAVALSLERSVPRLEEAARK